MVGMGDPKEAQSNSAMLLVMTWYTLLGGVRTRGGSAVTKYNVVHESILSKKNILYS